MRRWKRFKVSVRDWVNGLPLRLTVWVQTSATRLRAEAGQTVAEYALVLLVVAAIAAAFLLWARQSGKLDAFFDLIFDKLVDSVEPEATP